MNKSAKFMVNDEVKIYSENKIKFSIIKETSQESSSIKPMINTTHDVEFMLFDECLGTKVGRISILRVVDKRINVLECLLTQIDFPENENGFNKFTILCAAIELTAINRNYLKKK